MTKNQIKLICKQLPKGQRFSCAYTSYFKGIIVEAIDRKKNKFKYRATFNPLTPDEPNITLILA